MSCCESTTLNGAGALTEAARLRAQILAANCGSRAAPVGHRVSTELCCPIPPIESSNLELVGQTTSQVVPESVRLQTKLTTIEGPLTPEEARRILRESLQSGGGSVTKKTESSHLIQRIQRLTACEALNQSPTERFAHYTRQENPIPCPPLPPPPSYVSPACPLPRY